MAVAEAWVPSVNRRRDLFGFADVAAVHPHLAGPLLVQVTTADDLADRSRKVLRDQPRPACGFGPAVGLNCTAGSGGPAAGRCAEPAAAR